MKGVYLVHITDRMVLTDVCAFDFPKDIYPGQLLEAHDRGVILGGLHYVVLTISYIMSPGRKFLPI